jgi:hypothetical protein
MIKRSVKANHGSDRLYWHQFYVKRFNQNPANEQALHLAMWYLLLYLAFDENNLTTTAK